MIVRVREWYAVRSVREQRLLMAMAAIALPLLAWLLIVQPLGRAYDEALEEQLEAVDRHGRVLALVEAASRTGPARPVSAATGDLQLHLTESASQAGIALQSATPVDSDTIDVAIEASTAPSIGRWLRDLEARGIAVQELRMTPQANGMASLTARLARSR